MALWWSPWTRIFKILIHFDHFEYLSRLYDPYYIVVETAFQRMNTGRTAITGNINFYLFFSLLGFLLLALLLEVLVPPADF